MPGSGCRAGVDRLVSQQAWRVCRRKRQSGGSSRPAGSSLMTPPKRPKRAHRSFTAERANECWQLDDTTWQLADGSDVKILNVIDDHLPAARRLAGDDDLHRGGRAGRGRRQGGDPRAGRRRFLSDNARAFHGVLADALRHVGVRAGHSRPSHPRDLRQGRTLPPDVETLARQAASSGHARRAASPARSVPADLQPPASPPRHRSPVPLRRVVRHCPRADQPTSPSAHPPRPGTPPSPVVASKPASATASASAPPTTGSQPPSCSPEPPATSSTASHHIRHFTIIPDQRDQPSHTRPGRPTTLTERKSTRHA